MSRREISRKLNVSYCKVRHYTAPAINTENSGLLPLGRISFSTSLSKEQIAALDRLARKWGCATLAEAALEILRDGLEETL